MCRCRAAPAVDRGAGRRQDRGRLLESPGGDESAPGGPPREEPRAGGARRPTDEGRIGLESVRGPVLAWVPSPRLLGDVGVRLPGVGTPACAGGPGIAGEQKRPGAEVDGPGDPPRPPTIVVPDGGTGLRILQSILSFANWAL